MERYNEYKDSGVQWLGGINVRFAEADVWQTRDGLKAQYALSPRQSEAPPWVYGIINYQIVLKGQKHLTPQIMPQSLCKIYIHVIFHIKTTSPQILDDDMDCVQCKYGFCTYGAIGLVLYRKPKASLRFAIGLSDS